MKAVKKLNVKKLTGIILCFILMVLAILVVLPRLGPQEPAETRGVQSDDFAQFKRVEYDGQRYVRRSGTTVALLIGVDKTDDAPRSGYRDGGQADFLMLLVVDDVEKSVRMLHIDRDTMANITVLSVLGREVGTKSAQICLSHGFGATEEDNSRYTVQAVSNLLEGEGIDFYISANTNSIARINDALGGVTLTLQDDFSAYDPLMVPGATLTLTGRQAEYMVRSRYDIADGTNEMRMSRQRQYIDAAALKLRALCRSDAGFARDFLTEMESVITSDASMARIINVFDRAAGYDIQPIEYLKGEHRIGPDGFMEFHTAEKAAAEWVLSALYKPE